MFAPSKPRYKPRTMDYAICYGLCSLLFVVGYITTFIVWRQALALGLTVAVEDQFVRRFAYMAAMLLLAVALFIGIFAAEIYMRNGVRCRQIRRRFLRLAVPLAAVLVLGLAVREIALGAL
ncbi:MAG: hypothetical protein M3R38_18895 [Actinomycetota bacterium]|nr:hypothetical protein [Actinomycetota bacterium]MDP9477721.1 hypothetical protein [Actinomycetota bacterium]